MEFLRTREGDQPAAVIQGPLGGVAGRISSIGALAGSSSLKIAAVGIALSGLGVIAKRSVEAFAGVERQQLRIQALIKATGGAAGLTAKQIGRFAEELDRTTLTSAKAARDAAGVLLTFKSISGARFKKTLNLAQDLAAVMGTDLRGATLQLGKALESPATGLTALRRSGVSFTDSEKALIKSLDDAGRSAEAQRVILDTLQKQIGGAGTAEAGGLSGTVDTFAFQWEKLKETMGKGLVGKGLQAELRGLTIFFEKLLPATLESRLEALQKKRATAGRELSNLLAQDRGDPLAGVEERQQRARIDDLDKQIIALNRQIAARQDANRTAEAAADKKAGDRAAKVAGERARQAQATKTLARETDRLAKARIALESRLDPLAGGEREYRLELGRVDDQLRKGMITQREANRLTAAAGEHFTALKDRLESEANPAITVHVDKFKSLVDTQEEGFAELRQAVDGWSRDFALRLVDGSVSFHGFVDSALKELERIAVVKSTNPLFEFFGKVVQSVGQSLFAGAGAFAGGAGPAAGSFRAAQTVPALAGGGPVSAGRSYLVGERGPELLRLGRQGGRVVPNQALGAQRIKVEIVNRGAPKQVQSATPRIDPTGMVVTIIQEDVRRGGPISRTLGVVR